MKADLVSNFLSDIASKFFCDPACDRYSCDSPGLCASDLSVPAPSGLKADHRKLSCFTGTGFTGYYNHLVLNYCRKNFIFSLQDRQALCVADRRAFEFLEFCISVLIHLNITGCIDKK